MRRIVLCSLLALAGGCGFSVQPNGPAAGSHTGDPQTPEEKAVAEQILNGESAGAPGHSLYSDVEWLEWGPNDLTEQTHFDGPKRKIVRVRYLARLPKEPRGVRDELWAFGLGVEHPEVPVQFRENVDGSAWLEKAAAAKKAKEDAAMKGH